MAEHEKQVTDPVTSPETEATLEDCPNCENQEDAETDVEVAAEPTTASVHCPPNTFAYTVQTGDSLFTIAKKFGVSLDALLAANPQIKDPSFILPGQIVCVPKAHEPSICPPGTTAYTVIRGDTMFLIARRFGVSLQALIAANPQVKNPNRIYPGQTLCIPKAVPPTCPPGSTRYVVRPNDSMFLIAQRFGITLNALIRANPQVKDPNKIQPGQVLCVPHN